MSAQAEKKTNVIWIFGDQHRAQALGCNGDSNVRTPNIDQLAAMGTNCNAAVCGYPLCAPFRGTLFTGLYPHKCITGPSSLPEPELSIKYEHKTLADTFGGAGYHTAFFGKWHITGGQEKHGNASKAIVDRRLRGGFSQWLGYENNNSQYDCFVHGHDAAGSEIPIYRLPGYETDELTNLMIDFINGRKDNDQPYFAALSVQPPHDPYVAPGVNMQVPLEDIKLRPNVPNIPKVQAQARRELAGYYAMIENLDYNVGRIVQALRDSGQYFNTRIIFFSDHGDLHGSHGQFRKMSPYEESIRIPFIVSGGVPSQIQPQFSNAPINHVDIAPTTLGLCGIDKPDWMEGYDYSHLFILQKKAKTPMPDSAFIQSIHSLRHPNSVDKPWRGLITRDGWKYVALEGMEWLLFNLNDDPYEHMNLAHNILYTRKKEELNARLMQWIEQTGDSFKLPESFVQPVAWFEKMMADRI